MRSQIYLPVLRFGITDEDWGVVILASVLGYAIPFLFGTCWLKHTLQARLQGRVNRRRLPGDAVTQWLKTDRGGM